jgi:hypothetical protein
MSFDSLLIHRLAAERSAQSVVPVHDPPGATDGDLIYDEYGQPVVAYTTLATFRGRLTPKSVREVAQLSQAGAVVGDWTLYTRPRDLREADRIRLDPDDGRRFEIVGIRSINARGPHHLEADLRLVEAG